MNRALKRIEPRLPVEYEAALRALQACTELNEAKYWADKAEALAAWAKIYHSDEAQRKARVLKLHAFKRMGEIAHELRPNRLNSPAKLYENQAQRSAAYRARKRAGIRGVPAPGRGSAPGPVSLLQEQGFSKGTAKVISRIGKIPGPIFDSAVNSKNPPAPDRLALAAGGANMAWRDMGQALATCRAVMKRQTPHELAKTMSGPSVETARSLVIFISEWLDTFEAALRAQK